MMRRLFKNNAPATPQGEAPQAPDAKLLERIKTLRTNNAVQALDDQLDDL